MSPHVNVQIAAESETLSTHLAGERLLTRVDHRVLLQGRRLGKRFPTCAANVRLLTCVDPPVGAQLAALVETFPAGVADVRLLAGVAPVVLLHQAHVLEGFSANIAFYGAFTVVAGSLVPAVGRGGAVEEELDSVCFSFTVVAFLVKISHDETIVLVLQNGPLTFLIGAELLLLLFGP